MRNELYKEWKEMLQLIPKMQTTVLNIMQTHIQKRYEDKNRSRDLQIQEFNKELEESNVKKELQLIKPAFDLLQGKYILEVLFVLIGFRNPYFNEIKAALPHISNSTLSRRLKKLENVQIISRKVHDTTPIRVHYEFTDFGKGVVGLLIPLLIYISAEITDSRNFKD